MFSPGFTVLSVSYTPRRFCDRKPLSVCTSDSIGVGNVTVELRDVVSVNARELLTEGESGVAECSPLRDSAGATFCEPVKNARQTHARRK